MANTIITKNSATATAVPTAGQLVQGELAVNVTDKRLFTENSGGTVVELGVNPSSLTLTSGTANGVTYLNGSKVLTTGSALTFDGSNFKLTGSDNNNLVYSANSNGTTSIRMQSNAAGNYLVTAGADPWFFQNGSATGYMIFSPSSSSEAMRLNSTGLGIGTSSPAAKLHIGGNTASTQQAIFTTGVSDSDFKVVARNGVSGSTAVQGYIGLDYANGTWPLLAGMQFIRNSTSGELAFTAGATTSASEQMRLTSTGLGIGTSSPAAPLDVNGTIITRASGGEGGQVSFNNPDNASAGLTVDVSSADTARIFQTRNNSVMQIGQLAGTGGVVQFYTSGSERARIDSSGNLLVGTTSNPTGARLVVLGNRAATFTSTQANIAGLQVYSTSSNNDEPAILGGNASTASANVGTFYSSLGSGNGAQNNTNCYHLKAVTQGVGINYLYGNGTTSFTSDARLKKNITSTRDGYVEDLCKLRVVKYNWNNALEGEAQELGLIAQEVEQVFPGLVQDADTEIQGFTPKVLKGSVLPFMLLKAIQEQQAIIESLEARLDAANL